ncbi:cytochrome C assembly protein, partial [Rhodopirellula sp.]
MLAILREISVTCFFSSYLVVLLLESLRLWRRIPGRGLSVIVMASIGLVTHAAYILMRANPASVSGTEVGILASWYDWSLMLSLVLASSFLFFFIRRPDTMVGFFFLPAIMGLIVLAWIFRDMPTFSRSEATQFWTSLHAASMLIGSVGVLLGFIAGCMYLAQSWRLKNKRAGSLFRLPTLESLSRVNRRCLAISTTAVAGGLTAGIAMNLNQFGQVGLMDRTVFFSLLLLVWLLVATSLEFFYAPTSHSKKGIYITLVSLGFLILAMFGALTTSHGQSGNGTNLGRESTSTHPSSLPIHLSFSKNGETV